MLDIKIQKMDVPKECIQYLSLAWNGNIEIHISDATKGNYQKEFQEWIYACAQYDKHIIDDLIQIGNHVFDENRFEFSCNAATLMIPNKTEGEIKIVLIPKKGTNEALELKIGNMVIPKSFIQIIKFRGNRIQIRTQEPDLEPKTHEKLKELIALGGVLEKKNIIQDLKIGNHVFTQKFGFNIKPDLGTVGIKKGGVEIMLNLI